MGSKATLRHGRRLTQTLQVTAAVLIGSGAATTWWTDYPPPEPPLLQYAQALWVDGASALVPGPSAEPTDQEELVLSPSDRQGVRSG
jgi:hypothetical protein